MPTSNPCRLCRQHGWNECGVPDCRLQQEAAGCSGGRISFRGSGDRRDTKQNGNMKFWQSQSSLGRGRERIRFPDFRNESQAPNSNSQKHQNVESEISMIVTSRTTASCPRQTRCSQSPRNPPASPHRRCCSGRRRHLSRLRFSSRHRDR